MVLRRVAAVSVALVMTSTGAVAQQRAADVENPSPTSITERTYLYGGIAASRLVERRSASDGRVLVVVTEERPGVDGRWEPVEEVVTETVRPGAGQVRSRREIFAFDAERRRRLLSTTESTELPVAGGRRILEETWVPDVNGGTRLALRRLEEGGISTLFSRDLNGNLREIERTVQLEEEIEPGVVRYEETQLLRDPNGRWMPIAARRVDVRRPGAEERIEEETIQRLDTNGKLAIAERVVTRVSGANDDEQVLIEVYSHHGERFVSSASRLPLSQRIRRSTSAAADNVRTTIEDVEARSRVSPGDPMRMVLRTVVTERDASPDRRVTERQVFERDVNGRLAAVFAETEAVVAK